MSINERPGVYTSYEVSSAVSGRSGAKAVGLAAQGAGAAGEVTVLTSYAQAVSAFGAGSNAAELARILLENGASRVLATPVASGAAAEDYAAAFAALMGQSAVSLMVCDSRLAGVHAAMKAAIMGGGENYKYRIGVVEADGTAAELTALAAAINCERMAMVGNTVKNGLAGAAAAAAAGCIAAGTDPALPLNGAVLYGLGELSRSFSDSDVSLLIQGGVTPIEDVSGEISVIRGVTTRTTTSGVSDATWRELTTVLIVDDVIPAVRTALKTRFSRAKNTAQTRGAIRTQVMIELESKLRAQIIDSYGAVSVAADGTDPTVCCVSFDFTVAHGLNSVKLTAYITV